MKKTLYSLMLNDEIVREVDIMAHRLGTNRSSLINEILAEYVNYTTPEKRINDILSAMESLLRPSRELVPYFAPHSYSMSLKSSLEYKYRPTIKYEVELYRGDSETLGAITVIFRTQSGALIDAMSDFFRLWKKIEEKHLKNRPEFALYDGRFVRSISIPEKDCTSDELANAISEYISKFDTLMKTYLNGTSSASEIEEAYLNQMRRSDIII